MTRDPEVLLRWLHIALWFAAITTTLFPLLYAFSRWWEYLLGRILMLTMISLALAVDITLLFQYWYPEDILVVFWVNLVIFMMIGMAALAMCFKMAQLNFKRGFTVRLRRDK